ncbi:zinc ribbon domain-containing protein [Streptomyces sp. NPDC086519]|uniref:NADase-type glycan-binding domain-containing protein n=1 Tax=Streptomyces sp. NPDC086519 TaxID=3154863 RepID=UPI0034367EF9
MTTNRNCTECGTVAEPGRSFCDACGAVLSWAADKDEPPQQPPAPTSGAGPAWDAFTRRDGGTGLPPRDTRATTTTTPADPHGPHQEPAPAARLQGRGDVSDTATTAPFQGHGDVPEAAPAAGLRGRGDVSDTATTAPFQGRGDVPEAAPAAGRRGRGDVSDTATTAPFQGHGNGSDPATAAPRQGHGNVSDPGTAAPRQSHGDLSGAATAAPRQGRGELRDQPSPTATSPTAETTPIPTPRPPADEDHDRARRLLIPVGDPEPAPAPPTVAPVLPGRPTPQRPASVRAPGEDLGAHGGTPCPWCATPNRPDRHFCTRCAMPMAGHPGTAASAHRPWWRRIFDFRNRETPWAGDRPRLRRTFDRVLTWIVVALVLTGVTVLAVNTPKAISATRDHFAKRAQVSPDSYRASRSYAGHKPDLVFDKLNNTWWGPGVTQAGEGEWIEAHFDEPTRLLNVVITSGESTHNDQLKKSALPHRMTATIKTADGKTETREITLDQTAGGQTRDFRAADVVSVRFTIESSYQASADTQVAIAEIEFFGPSSANS